MLKFRCATIVAAAPSTRKRLQKRQRQSDGQGHEKTEHAFESQPQQCCTQKSGGQASHPHATPEAAWLAHPVDQCGRESHGEGKSHEQAPAIVSQ